jgi:hypothetical protein
MRNVVDIPDSSHRATARAFSMWARIRRCRVFMPRLTKNVSKAEGMAPVAESNRIE